MVDDDLSEYDSILFERNIIPVIDRVDSFVETGVLGEESPPIRPLFRAAELLCFGPDMALFKLPDWACNAKFSCSSTNLSIKSVMPGCRLYFFFSILSRNLLTNRSCRSVFFPQVIKVNKFVDSTGRQFGPLNGEKVFAMQFHAFFKLCALFF